MLAVLLGRAQVLASSVVPDLPRLNIDAELVSISGLSSGADFAAQFAVAFSKSIMGVGVFAGQPWHCAVTYFPNETTYPIGNGSNTCGFCEGCPSNQTVQCDHCKTSPNPVDVSILAEAAKRYAEEGKIDDVGNMKRIKAYTYCGTKDYHLGATIASRDFFAQFMPSENILYNFSIPSGHCWPEDYGIKKCGDEIDKGLWAVENCDYDGPGELLQHIYGKLNARAEELVPENLQLFNQLPFNTTTAKTNLGAKGYVYIPRACADMQKCSLHISLHGCSNPMPLEDAQAHALSFNRWAETNNMVVLWPKAMGESCWHGYGREGQSYDTKNGQQMVAVRQMIEAISGMSM